MAAISNKCLICNDEKEPNELGILKCNHSFCWKCICEYLKVNLQKSETPKIKCPKPECNAIFRDSLIRHVLPEELIEKYESLCISVIKRVHKCILPECLGSVMYSNPDIQYECHSCRIYNCIKCKASHNFVKCADYQSMSDEAKLTVCQPELIAASKFWKENNNSLIRTTLQDFENVDLLPNRIVFDCPLCNMNICKGKGIELRNCSDLYCRSCLNQYITTIKKVPAICPKPYCKAVITDREIQSIISKTDLKIYLIKCNNHMKKSLNSFYQCQTPNCTAIYDFESKPKEFTCRICKSENCVECKTIHVNESCQEYQNKLKYDVTYNSIQKKLQDRKIMKCVGCNTLLEKIKGCNWVQCHNCSLELCWVLQIPRWGPRGRGDNSGGCKCGVDGKRCDPKCTSSCIPHS